MAVKKENRCVLSGFGNGYPKALLGKLFFTWHCPGAEGKQQSYMLKICNGKDEVIWASGWVCSDQSDSVPYEGSTLPSDSDYVAQVIVVDGKGNHIESQPEYFSTGLTQEEWRAQWLCPSQIANGNAAPLFRKEFEISKEVSRARLYITGLGYQETYINGQRTGKDILSPTWTDYRKRISYNTYDIKGLLHTGVNVVGIQMGNGWLAKTLGLDDMQTFFSAQISLEYADREKEWICSKVNDGWYTSDGPIKTNSIYIGEVYDARAEKAEWHQALGEELDRDVWRDVLIAQPPTELLVPQDVEAIEPVMELTPVSITEPEKGVWVIDFGQNIAGYVELETEEAYGTEISIRFAEILWKNGMLNTDNLRAAQAKDIFISSGKKKKYSPRFTYHGFRYAEVTGITRPLHASQIKALVVRNTVKTVGCFETDNEVINKIQNICYWTENNNLHGVPTDCPQRDERLGWLNDLTVRAEEAIFNFDMHRFYNKFLQDIADTQDKTGAIADVAPYIHIGNQPADPVCSSYLLLGWLLYMYYGDKAVLVKFYDGFASWTSYLDSVTEDGIVSYSYYGDWASPIAGAVEGSSGCGAVSAITPGKLMSTGFLHYNANLMTAMAEVLGKTDDIAKWQTIASRTKAALNRKYYHEEAGNYATNSQAANTFMVWLGVSPDKQRTIEAIVADVRLHHGHLTTGNICSRYILEVLTENGYVDLAFDMVTQDTYPSWGYMVKMGATTTWERWEYVDSGPLLGMASHDHPMYSTVSFWFYRYLLGLKPTEAGFKEFKVEPYLPQELNWAKGGLDTIKGRIDIEWKKQDDNTLYLSVIVPFNTRCKLVVPPAYTKQLTDRTAAVLANRELYLEAGAYEITFSR